MNYGTVVLQSLLVDIGTQSDLNISKHLDPEEAIVVPYRGSPEPES